MGAGDSQAMWKYQRFSGLVPARFTTLRCALRCQRRVICWSTLLDDFLEREHSMLHSGHARRARRGLMLTRTRGLADQTRSALIFFYCVATVLLFSFDSTCYTLLRRMRRIYDAAAWNEYQCTPKNRLYSLRRYYSYLKFTVILSKITQISNDRRKYFVFFLYWNLGDRFNCGTLYDRTSKYSSMSTTAYFYTLIRILIYCNRLGN